MTSAQNLRVLIVDDDSDIREMLQTLLEVHDFHVETLRDGIDALDLKSSYDAILLDVRMPVFDGERLIDYWLMTNPQLLQRVIIMTGYSQLPRRGALPAFAVVQKPFQYEDIVRVVSDCAARSRRHEPVED